jgi:hypothetical protein
VGGAVGAILNAVLGTDRILFREDPLDARIPAIAIGLYVVAFVGIYRTVLYTRPIAHYALVGSAAALIAYQIWIGQPRRQVLTQVVVLAFFSYWSTQFIYPAGVLSPDGGFVSTSATIAQTGAVPTGVAYQNTPAHMIYVAEGLLLTGLSGPIGYQLLSVCALLTTVLLVGSIDRAAPRLPRRVALYGALVFALMSFTLRRGMFPGKTNFFKPLLMILLLASLFIIHYSTNRQRWSLLAVACLPTLVFGHTYSAGAALLLVGSVWAYHRTSDVLDGLDYESALPRPKITALFTIICVAVVGYSLIGGSGIINRSAGISTSVFDLFAPAAQTQGTSGGRYSALSLRVLLFSTVAQGVLFALSVLGIGLAIRRRDWSLDLIVVWIAVGLGLLGFSAIANAVDIPTPRIYFLLVVFGLNLVAAIGVFRLAHSATPSVQSATVAVVTFLFVVSSLASPVGSVGLSPVSDEIPSKWRYETAPDLEEHAWADEFGTESLLETRSTGTEIPLKRTGAKTVGIDYANLSGDTPYEYRDLARDRGVGFGGRSESLGGNQILFLSTSGEQRRDSRVYANGKSTVFVHINSTY